MNYQQRNPAELRAFLEDEGIDFGACVAAFGESADASPYVRAAHGKICEGELEVDDTAVVSDGDDNGAYVQAWVWVSFEEAGIDSSALEAICSALAPVLSIQNNEEWPLLAQLSWLEETISNFAEELDEIDTETPVLPVSTEITWSTDFGTYQFTAYAAITALIQETEQRGVSDPCTRQAAQIWVDRFGEKLSRMLCAYSCLPEVVHA